MCMNTYAIFDDKNLVKFFNIGRALTNQFLKRYERKDMHRTLSLETWCFAKVIMSSKCRERKTQLTAEKKNPSKQ